MKKETNKFLFFVRKNAIYLILSACILAVGLSITFMVVKERNELSANNDKPTIEAPNEQENPDSSENPDDKPTTNPDQETPDVPVSKPIVFGLPVLSPTSIGEYSESMVFNNTMGRFTAHMAIDFFADEGTDVLAVYDGKISNVENSILKGTTVTIDHGNGLFTVYNSLADGDSVIVGQTVKQGDVIGQVSLSNRQEYKSGAHLHFEVIENGESIDPSKYIAFEEK